MYLETAQRLKAQQGKGGDDGSETQQTIEQLDFEFVLFAFGADRLRLHHGLDRPLQSGATRQADHEPRAAHQPARGQQQSDGRARRTSSPTSTPCKPARV
ncbi:MAG: hypothetical protein MZU84_02620 [Sphingobacterium sp.]|nr:hypothetical protein [Sphingobacterium sp.]